MIEPSRFLDSTLAQQVEGGVAQTTRNGSYDAFRQRVRRHRRSDLLKAVADLNVRLERAVFRDDPPLKLPDVVQRFSLAGIAGTALIAANEYRSRPVTIADLCDMCDLYVNIAGKKPADDAGLSSLRALLNPLLYEQMPYQSTVENDVGRSLVLLVDHANACCAAKSPAEWAEHLGVPLETFLRLGFAMYVAALQNGGVINRTVLSMDHVAPIYTPLTPDKGLEVIDRWFAATPEQHRYEGSREEVRGAEKWSLNPLVAKPIVTLPNGDYVMPSPRLIVNRITPTGLYFIGLAGFGSGFTDSLGCLFEEYVNAQLGLLNHTDIRREISYDSPIKKTVDFFVITPEVVLLVEVKASRPTRDTRFGCPDGDTDVRKKIGKAYTQIDQTAQLLRGNHPAVANIPSDRPLCGLVVTLEPFNLTKTVFYEDLFEGLSSIPVIVESSNDFETAVAALSDAPDIGTRLLNAWTSTDKPVRSLNDATTGLPTRNNPILHDAWNRFTEPWSSVAE